MESKEIQSVIEQFSNELIDNIRENMASYGLGDSRLAQSLEPEIEGNHLKIWANDYFEYAEKGRPAGKIPFNFTDILEEWISRRNISHTGSTRQFASAIAWKTYREGSYLYRNPSEQRDFLDGVLDEPMAKFQDAFNIFIKDNLKTH